MQKPMHANPRLGQASYARAFMGSPVAEAGLVEEDRGPVDQLMAIETDPEYAIGARGMRRESAAAAKEAKIEAALATLGLGADASWGDARKAYAAVKASRATPAQLKAAAVAYKTIEKWMGASTLTSEEAGVLRAIRHRIITYLAEFAEAIDELNDDYVGYAPLDVAERHELTKAERTGLADPATGLRRQAQPQEEPAYPVPRRFSLEVLGLANDMYGDPNEPTLWVLSRELEATILQWKSDPELKEVVDGLQWVHQRVLRAHVHVEAVVTGAMSIGDFNHIKDAQRDLDGARKLIATMTIADVPMGRPARPESASSPPVRRLSEAELQAVRAGGYAVGSGRPYRFGKNGEHPARAKIVASGMRGGEADEIELGCPAYSDYATTAAEVVAAAMRYAEARYGTRLVGQVVSHDDWDTRIAMFRWPRRSGDAAVAVVDVSLLD